MPFIPLQIPSGVIKTDSEYSAIGRWTDADKVRFYRGFPEKVGGVLRFIEDTFTGYARGARAWSAYDGTQIVGFGTAAQFRLVRNGSMSVLTPYRASGISLTDPFSTTSGQAVVTVTDTAHGITTAGTYVNFTGASAVGGLTISGDYTVTEVLTADTFTITASSNASGTATGGGSVTANYCFNAGSVDAEYLRGWGYSLWGYGSWGTLASAALSLVSEPMWWSLDNYGEDLIVNPLNGGLYYYDASAGAVRPTLMSGAPEACRFVFVTSERYIFALGCTRLAGGQDFMTVRWPDVEDSTDWTPSSTNTANERKLQGGSRLMGGCAFTSGIAVVWSDSHAFQFQFTGSSTIYDSRPIGSECGLIGPHAFAKTDGMVFWMSNKDFHVYNGGVQSIPNSSDIANWVFDNLNIENAAKSFAYYQKDFNEVWFHFPTTDTECDSYVAVNLDDYSWTVGTFDRTAAAKFMIGEGRPILFSTGGRIYVHDSKETANEDDAVMRAYLRMAPIELQNGNVSADIFGFIPDCERQTGDMTVRLYGKDHPRDTEFHEDEVTVTSTDKLVDTRVAGRQLGLEITSEVSGGDFRLGKMAVEISQSGKRR